MEVGIGLKFGLQLRDYTALIARATKKRFNKTRC